MDIQEIILQLQDSSNQDIIIYVTIFIMIFALVFGILEKLKLFEQNKSINPVISLAIAILSIVYFSDKQIATVLSSYNILGFLFTFLLPFFLIMVLIHKPNTTPGMRRGVWLVFLAVSLYLWFNDYTEISNGFIVLSLIIVGIVIVFDESINKMFHP